MHGSNDVGGWRRWRKARVVRWKRCHLEATHDRPTRVTYFRVSRRQLPNAGVAPVTARLTGPPLSLSPPARRPSAPSRPIQSGYLSAAIGRRGHRHRPGTFPESAARPSSRRRHRQFAPADFGIAARARKMSSADTAADDSIFVVVVHFILL